MGLCQPMMATYRPHNNPLMEWVQTRGRMRSNKAMIGRNNLRGIVGALKKAVWFAPDQTTVLKAAPLRHFSRLKTSPPPTVPMYCPAVWRRHADRYNGKEIR